MKTQVVIEGSSKPVKVIWMIGRCMTWVGCLILSTMFFIEYKYPYLTATTALGVVILGGIFIAVAKFMNFWDRGSI
jgi:hypothetical protein